MTRPPSGNRTGNTTVIRRPADTGGTVTAQEKLMEFRILGPLEVVDGEQPIVLRRGKECALLAYLVLHANEVVPSERLIDELWDERPPPTAPKIKTRSRIFVRRSVTVGCSPRGTATSYAPRRRKSTCANSGGWPRKGE